MKAEDIVALNASHDLFNKHTPDSFGICTSCFMPTKKDGFTKDSFRFSLEKIYSKSSNQFIEILLALIQMKAAVSIATFVNIIPKPKKEKKLAKVENEILKRGGDEVYKYVESVDVFKPLSVFRDVIVKTGSPRSAFYYVMYVQNVPCLETFERVKEDPSIEQFYIDYAERNHPREFKKVCKEFTKKQIAEQKSKRK